MPRYDQDTAECLVYTFKDGLLAKVAHDLKIRVTRFSLQVDPTGPSVQGEFAASSLQVEAVMKDGREHAEDLSGADKAKITEQIRQHVLHSNRYPTIAFHSRAVSARADGGHHIEGLLDLHGVERLLSFDTRLLGDWQVAEIELQQPDFGITPFKAMMGTLKIKPELRVRVAIPKS
jgi:hypothetical protein